MNHTDDTYGIRRVVGPTILTHTGHYFDFEEPHRSFISVVDIAHALSHLCRFTGHTRRFYSVAEHSVHVSHLVPPKDALAGLLHDAAEAYMGDVSRPLKSMLPQYKAIETRVEAAVLAHFGIPATLPPSVKEADRAMLAVEQRQAMGNADAWPGVDGGHDRVTLAFWTPEQAKSAFLARCEVLQSFATAHRKETP